MDTNLILLGLVFSSIGFGYFIYGKQQSNPVARYTGVVLMVYPYFVPDAVVLILVGIVLLFIPKFIKL
tara:strand:- start:13065 stop:13268 length:204 start_codon:yes stop_codon:yes gene_type:complete